MSLGGEGEDFLEKGEQGFGVGPFSLFHRWEEDTKELHVHLLQLPRISN